MRFETKPLPAIWPGGRRTPPHERTWGPFRAGSQATMELLELELRKLGAREPVTWHGGYGPHEIRRDGLPRAGARPSDPAVVLSFDCERGRLQFCCDRYSTDQQNVRAIALAMKALRAVDRYEVGHGDEHYRGFEAIPARTGLTTDEAEVFIRNHANGGGLDQDLATAYLAALKKLNPQLPGASRDLWDTLMQAKEALGL